MRKLWPSRKLITREEAVELIGDPQIMSKKNKKSRYYLVLMNEDSNFKGVFVVRDNTVITFKTTTDQAIWASLKAKYA